MEWVETTGRTVEEAKRSALEQLGVEQSDAEFEIIAEPRIGLFGRLKEEARVRARVQPRYPRSKGERRDRRRVRANRPDQSTSDAVVPTSQSDVDRPAPTSRRRTKTEDSAPRGAGQSGPRHRRRTGGAGTVMGTTDKEEDSKQSGPVDVAELAKAAEGFLAGLLREVGVAAEISWGAPSADTLEILVNGDDLGTLIGPKGTTLSALQELTRIAVQRQTPRSEQRVVVDINGYRHRRTEALAKFAEQIASDVVASQRKRALEPMPAADRKVVHDAIGAIQGASTISEGEEPYRRVVVIPAPPSEAGTQPDSLEGAPS